MGESTPAVEAEAGSIIATDEPSVPHALCTPPATSGESNKTDGDDSLSELSDIDMDDDDEEDAGFNDPPKPRSGLEDILEPIPEGLEEIEPAYRYGDTEIPVFTPTMDEFQNFRHFISRIMRHGMTAGVVKVIPPKEWTEKLPRLDETVKSIKVKNPIEQDFEGRFGIYMQANHEKQRSYNLPQWKALCEESQHLPPGWRDSSKQAASQSSKSRAKPTQTRATRRNKRLEEGETPEPEHGPPTPASTGEVGPKKRGRKPQNSKPQASSVTSRRTNNRREINHDVDNEAFNNFDYKLDGLDFYTKEKCEELEKIYWKHLTFNKPIYGADMPGSLFDESKTTCWNVAKLPNLLNVLGKEVPGVNTTYLYLGMWKATFSWHLEDMDLFSINYIHFGAPKQWYSISQRYARNFESVMKTEFSAHAKQCDQFLRHKTFHISPAKLAERGVTVNKMVHYEGEFVITFPYGYHSGYNLGYNCAESVNFATEEWLDYGSIAKKCNCESDSVFVNVDEIKRKLNGEPTPEPEYEYYGGMEIEHPDVLTPPTSTDDKPARRPRGRKRKAKSEPGPVVIQPKRLKLRVVEKSCELCPNDIKHEQMIESETGKKVHRLCALYIPETNIVEMGNVKKAIGVSQIPKARKDLRCSHCHVREGSCFQCSEPKCTTAFHATCAAVGQVQVESYREPVTFLDDEQEYWRPGYDFRCVKHRARRGKDVDENSLEADAYIREQAEKLEIGNVVQYQYLGPGQRVNAGLVRNNNRALREVTLRLLPDGPLVDVDYKYLLFLRPEEQRVNKASASAIPIPPSKFMDKSSSIEELPKENDAFLSESDPYRWSEFVLGEFDKDQPREFLLDPKKTPTYWYYLGKTSTEAKPQYTDDPAKPVHNPKSAFLDPNERRPPPASMGPPTSYAASYPTIRPTPPGLQAPAAQKRNAASGFKTPARPEKPYQYKPKKPVPPGANILPRVSPGSQSQQHTKSHQWANRRSGSYQHPVLAPNPVSRGQAFHQPGIPPQGPNFVQRGPSQHVGGLNPTGNAPAGRKGHPAMAARREIMAPYGNSVQQPAKPLVKRPSEAAIPYDPNRRHADMSTSSSNAGDTGVPSARSVQLIQPFVRSPNVRVDNPVPAALKRFDYLYKSYVTTPNVYQSPYHIGGNGFTGNFLPNPEAKTSMSGSLAQSYFEHRTEREQDLIRSKTSYNRPSCRLLIDLAPFYDPNLEIDYLSVKSTSNIQMDKQPQYASPYPQAGLSSATNAYEMKNDASTQLMPPPPPPRLVSDLQHFGRYDHFPQSSTGDELVDPNIDRPFFGPPPPAQATWQ